ncbi:MAG: tetratricopeptide repeat protein [Bacteroidales bacterium]|nr:tetratricopeptide repeat protein [Bacteroidales bacterium]
MNRVMYIWVLLMVLGAGASAQYHDHRNRHVDSLEAVLGGEHPPQGDELLAACTNLMWGLLNTDAPRAAGYAQRALALSYELDRPGSRASVLRILGLIAHGGNLPDSALAYYDWALAVVDSMRDDRRYTEADIDNLLSALYGSIANVYNKQDRLHLAMAYYQKALPIFEKYGWAESSAILLYNVGELYRSMGNLPEAERNYLRAIDAARLAGDSLLSAVPHKGLARIYIARGEFDQAERAARRAYDYYSSHIDEENNEYVETLVHLARIELKGRQRVDRAMAKANEALSRMTNETDTETRADVYNVCCEIAMQGQRWQQALDFAHRAIDADTAETFADIGSYVHLAHIYTELGDKRQALAYVDKIYNGMVRFATRYYQSSLSQLEVLYETEKKQASIEQLTKEKRWYLWAGILTALLLLLTALLFFLLWRSAKLSRQHALVKAKLDGELAERVRISRDLHDRLGGLLTALKLNLDECVKRGNSPVHELTEAAISEVRNVAHHLLPDSLRRYGLRVALRDYCHTLKHVHFAFVGDELRIAHQEALYCIAYELINNALKSSGASTINVQLMADAQNVVLNVCDNGNGLHSSDAEGFGLQNIRNRVAAIGGELTIFAEQGVGMEINIEIKHGTARERNKD